MPGAPTFSIINSSFACPSSSCSSLDRNPARFFAIYGTPCGHKPTRVNTRWNYRDWLIWKDILVSVAVTLTVLRSARSRPPGTLSGFSLSPVIDALLLAVCRTQRARCSPFYSPALIPWLPDSFLHEFSTGYSPGLRSASTHLNG
jgi:hypothetical protein